MARQTSTGHHSVYVGYLRNPMGDGKAGYYVGMTGLTPEQRFENHKAGLKAARVVRTYGERLVPKLYVHLNPMPYHPDQVPSRDSGASGAPSPPRLARRAPRQSAVHLSSASITSGPVSAVAAAGCRGRRT